MYWLLLLLIIILVLVVVWRYQKGKAESYEVLGEPKDELGVEGVPVEESIEL